MPTPWSSAYETGDTRIDNQHKQLFDYVGQLEHLIQRVEAGEALDHQAAQDILFFLDTYVNVHFAYEEICMTIRKCPVALKNREAHNQLLDFYQGFFEEAQQHLTLEMLVQLRDTLDSWLVGHICNIDTQLKNTPEAGSAPAPRRRS